MLISYNHFCVTNCTNDLCPVDVSVSPNSIINGVQSIFFIKTSILVFTIPACCLMRLGNLVFEKTEKWSLLQNYTC